MESNALAFTGATGEVRWGYAPAATLSSWTFTPDHSGGGILRATVVQMDPFRASQQPLTFVVPRPKGEPWRWRILSLQFAGLAFSATLAPQE